MKSTTRDKIQDLEVSVLPLYFVDKGHMETIFHALEELGELTQALAKWQRGDYRTEIEAREAVAREVADVENMLVGLRLILGRGFVNDFRLEKLQKIKKKLKKK